MYFNSKKKNTTTTLSPDTEHSILFPKVCTCLSARARVAIYSLLSNLACLVVSLFLVRVAVVVIVKKAVIPLLMLLAHWQMCSCLNSQYFLFLPPLPSSFFCAHTCTLLSRNNIRMKKKKKKNAPTDRSFYSVIEFLLMVSA